MRHFSSSLWWSVGVCALFSACASAPQVPDMDPEEVLAKSAVTSRTMQSATLNGSFRASLTSEEPGMTFAISGTLDGVFQDMGNDVSFTLRDGAVTGISAATGPFNALYDASIVAFVPGDVYVRVDRFDIADEKPLISKELLLSALGKWWRLPSTEVGPDAVTVTPDPTLLRAQSEVVRITEDKGVTLVSNHPSYHYAVSVDNEKLLAYLRSVAQEQGESFNETEVRSAIESLKIDGELLIDAESFFIRRISWDITRVGTEGAPGDVSITFMMTLDKHNAAPEIVPPADAEVFSPLLLLGTGNGLPQLNALPPVNAGQQDPFGALEGMTQEQQQEYILQLMEQGTVPFPLQQ